MYFLAFSGSFCWENQSSTKGVCIHPGHIQFTRMPSLAKSRAIPFVMAIIPPFVAEYAPALDCPTSPTIELMLTIAPLVFLKYGMQYFEHRKIPLRFVSIIKSHS